MRRLQILAILSRPPRALALLVLASSLAACNTGTAGPDVPQGISVVSGNNQFATVGTATANPLVALVVDPASAPFAGAAVKWTVTGGGGTVGDSTSTSDASGYVTMTYTAGANPGVATVVATVDVWTTTFTIYIEAPSNSVARGR
jgi:predicted small secreted protein